MASLPYCMNHFTLSSLSLSSLSSPSANSLQAAVFLNRKPQAEWLAARLSSEGFPSAYLSGGDRPQEERMKAMEAVRGFKLRVRRREWLVILCGLDN